MQKNNPACYECLKGKNNLHIWSPIIKNEEIDGALCLMCGLFLTKEQAEDMRRE